MNGTWKRKKQVYNMLLEKFQLMHTFNFIISPTGERTARKKGDVLNTDCMPMVA